MKWLNRSLLDSPYSYALCTSEKKFKKELKRLGLPKSNWPDFLTSTHVNATVHFFDETESHGQCCIVCLGDTKEHTKIQVYSLLVHEAVHIWQAIRDSIGERYPASEQEAYAIQRIVQSLMYAYKEQVK